MDNKAPTKEFKLGHIKLTVWKNETKYGTRLSLTPKRIYRQDDTWKDTDSFGPEDLPILQELMRQALSWLEYNDARNDKDTGGAA